MVIYKWLIIGIFIPIINAEKYHVSTYDDSKCAGPILYEYSEKFDHCVADELVDVSEIVRCISPNNSSSEWSWGLYFGNNCDLEQVTVNGFGSSDCVFIEFHGVYAKIDCSKSTVPISSMYLTIGLGFLIIFFI